MNVPILPVQAAGAGVQAISGLLSAGISFTRARKYMQMSNATIFAPRGLAANIMSTKKMMNSVGCHENNQKGKLKLPPLSKEVSTETVGNNLTG